MKKNIFAFLLVVSLAVSTQASVARAHGGEEHEEGDGHDPAIEAVEAAVEGINSPAQLEQIIAILKQVLALATERNRLLTVTYPAPQGHTEPVAHVMDPSMDDHHEDTASGATAEKKFVIEVETHGDKTHVHARYLDKPEDMFFVDANIHDEAALIADIKAHTGLSEDVIKPALKYFE